MTNQRFEALSRMCLNNWHYIDKKVLSFNKEINFFTGHSGSGKSTIIDALQIILYANTDGRGFFNKAASEESDRSLIEYLRGMINIGDNNENAYLRNHNFSTTIVLELQRTDTSDCQCVGAVFDIDTSNNEWEKRFFWHKGELLENNYRTKDRAMTKDELVDYLNKNFEKGESFHTARNESFRRKLYDDYLGGLDMDKFPMLFKRAIPFKMNSKLEDFVKEYICIEQDIHIEDMQESVMQYGRMQKKISDTCDEIRELESIHDSYEAVLDKQKEIEKYKYFEKKFLILDKASKIKELEHKISFHKEDIEKLKAQISKWEQQRAELNSKKEELIRLIAETGYDEAENQLKNVNELLERMTRSKARWDSIARGLKEWSDNELTSNSIIWSIDKFSNYTITEAELISLKNAFTDLFKDIKSEKEDIDVQIKEIRRQLNEIQEELNELKQGGKAYPKEISEARQHIFQQLYMKYGKGISVDILADLIDIKDEKFRNAVEGYMGNNKLLIVVAPKYVKDAMEIYKAMDKKKYFKAAVLDTERIMKRDLKAESGSLSEAVKTNVDYVQAYINFLLGNVHKCNTIDELRNYQIAVTPDCLLYHGYKLQNINPDNYTKWAYIGVESLKRRIVLLKKNKEDLDKSLAPKEDKQKELFKTLKMEALDKEIFEYMELLGDIEKAKSMQAEKNRLERKIIELKQKDVGRLEEEKKAVQSEYYKKEENIRSATENIGKQSENVKKEEESYTLLNNELMELESEFIVHEQLDSETVEISVKENRFSYDQLSRRYGGKQANAVEEKKKIFNRLCEVRGEYLRRYPNRAFSTNCENNEDYDKLFEALRFTELEKYQAICKEQAKSAIEHFKDDFIFKIRSAIKDAIDRKNELNKIINNLDFGKDKYKFIFKKNTGEDGKYYDMFMDESLDINPNDLSDNMSNQMNIFTIEHENSYGEMMNELISIFIPPVDATSEELEAAKKNMDKYADYRTYLSFDMQQIIKSGSNEEIKLKLSKMLKKNSGGEGQNPLYVALLASFAQAYRINMSPKLLRTPTIRLVVLDEAFSKMDGEKVASCISLIRKLGFQVIISATNDKIQNYLENVDKTFVFANPNKKSISIQEFEKKDFGELSEE